MHSKWRGCEQTTSLLIIAIEAEALRRGQVNREEITALFSNANHRHRKNLYEDQITEEIFAPEEPLQIRKVLLATIAMVADIIRVNVLHPEKNPIREEIKIIEVNSGK